jgi:general secretion pathway protein F
MKFIYKAKKGLDDTIRGTIDAENREEALSKLIQQGFFPISVEEPGASGVSDAAGGQRPQAKPIKKSSKRITTRDVLQFTQKLATLTRAKVELLSSLKIIYEQTDNARLQDIILDIYNGTKEGKVFSDLLSRYPGTFSALFVNIVKAGETSGKLDIALDQISEFSAREENLKTKVKVALAYPTLLLLVGLSSIFILINFVVPRLKPIFANLGDRLPLITKIILQISMLSNKSWWVIIGVAALALFIIYKQKGSVFFRRAVRRIKLSLPILERLTRNQELSYFSHALGMLLKSGVPALSSLQVATPTIEDPKLKKELEDVCSQVAAGNAIAKSMADYTSLPNFFVKMIAVGEESGRLSEVLDEIFHSYTEQIEMDITFITSLMEPVLILVLGLILGSIVLAILLPTFQITQIVH